MLRPQRTVLSERKESARLQYKIYESDTGSNKEEKLYRGFFLAPG